jgi:AraC family transcriptional regulator of adaptative response/methylated-DNA-[protein]-cysteine methyltransferase
MENSESEQYDQIAKTIGYLINNFKAQPDLETVAAQIGLSPSYLQRLFTAWVGISPKKFLSYTTAAYLKNRLDKQATLWDVATEVGLESPARLYDLMISVEAIPPSIFRSKGEGLTIAIGTIATPFGQCFIAFTKTGITDLHFLDADLGTSRGVTYDMATKEINAKWPNAKFQPADEEAIAFYQQQLTQLWENGMVNAPLKLQVLGTSFQLKVWEALLRIAPGQVESYQDIAKAIGQPKASQAVGNAVGANPIGFLIPCHRVIRATGVIGEYRWGKERKIALLGYEMAKQETKRQTL